MTPSLGDPRPISDSLQKHLTDVLSKIPSGRRGQAEVAVSTSGVEASVGARGHVKGVEVGGSGWAAREWGGKGWSAGARGSVVF